MSEIPQHYSAYNLTVAEVGSLDPEVFDGQIFMGLSTSDSQAARRFTLDQLIEHRANAGLRSAHLSSVLVEVWEKEMRARTITLCHEIVSVFGDFVNKNDRRIATNQVLSFIHDDHFSLPNILKIYQVLLQYVHLNDSEIFVHIQDFRSKLSQLDDDVAFEDLERVHRLHQGYTQAEVFKVKIAQAMGEMIHPELIRMFDAEMSPVVIDHILKTVQVCFELTIDEVLEELWLIDM